MALVEEMRTEKHIKPYDIHMYDMVFSVHLDMYISG